jgi:ArsR family transcriptional regulator
LKLVLARRNQDESWADSVAGEMRRHYSPGRTFEATSRAMLELLQLGDVIDIASGDGSLAEILAPRVKSLLCLDISEKVIAAGQQRLADYPHVSLALGDMHQLPCADHSADQVLLLHALTYTQDAAAVVAEAARVLRPQGQILVATLKSHSHKQMVEPFGHLNTGFTEAELSQLVEAASLTVKLCEVTSREARSPQFEVITLLATKP